MPLLLLLLLAALLLSPATSKSTIEPCSTSDTCPALLSYTLYTDLKVAEVASLFNLDPVALLAANSLDVAFPDVENRILPAGLFLKVPVACACSDGIRKASTKYRARPSDTLESVAGSVYSGLVSADQIRDANGLSDPVGIDVGESLVVPLPCTCFNSSDNGLPAVYLSYVVRKEDSVAEIAARWFTTVTDVMDVNGMGSPSVKGGDIIAVPLPACASKFPSYASDFGMIVPNGSYTITASHCVQCSCGPGDSDLYCTPASLAVSCSSMQCNNSNLIVGNFTAQQTSGGCNVVSCNYGGYANGTILTTLSTTLQPRCPAQRQSPTLLPPPTTVPPESVLAPSPAPSESHGTGGKKPASSVPATMSLPSMSPTGGPMEGASTAQAVRPLFAFFHMLVPFLFFLVLCS